MRAYPPRCFRLGALQIVRRAGAAESPTTTTIPPYWEYGRIFAGVAGQDIVIETAAGGMVTINLLEDDEDNDRELLHVDAPLAQSPCLVDSQLP